MNFKFLIPFIIFFSIFSHARELSRWSKWQNVQYGTAQKHIQYSIRMETDSFDDEKYFQIQFRNLCEKEHNIVFRLYPNHRTLYLKLHAPGAENDYTLATDKKTIPAKEIIKNLYVDADDYDLFGYPTNEKAKVSSYTYIKANDVDSPILYADFASDDPDFEKPKDLTETTEETTEEKTQTQPEPKPEPKPAQLNNNDKFKLDFEEAIKETNKKTKENESFDSEPKVTKPKEETNSSSVDDNKNSEDLLDEVVVHKKKSKVMDDDYKPETPQVKPSAGNNSSQNPEIQKSKYSLPVGKYIHFDTTNERDSTEKWTSNTTEYEFVLFNGKAAQYNYYYNKDVSVFDEIRDPSRVESENLTEVLEQTGPHTFNIEFSHKLFIDYNEYNKTDYYNYFYRKSKFTLNGDLLIEEREEKYYEFDTVSKRTIKYIREGSIPAAEPIVKP